MESPADVASAVAAGEVLAVLMRSHYNRLAFTAAGGFAVASDLVIACCNTAGDLGVPLYLLFSCCCVNHMLQPRRRVYPTILQTWLLFVPEMT
jgi:hypothetical protein